MEQNINQEMIDTTDSLEAVSVMKGMKNFLFWVVLAGLFVSQAMFWWDRFGLIDKTDCSACPAGISCNSSCPMRCAEAAGSDMKNTPPQTALQTGLVPLAAAAAIAEQVDQVVQKADLQPPAEPAAEAAPVTEQPVVPAIVPPAAETAAPATVEPSTDVEPFAVKDKEMEYLRISCRTARCIVRVSNFVSFMGAILYCLTLLMNLKISLTGKLGGINHISRAFFCSLFLLVFLTPWQVLLPGAVIGALYLPGELLCGAWAKADGSVFWKVLLYLRFSGLWVLAVWMLISAQMRSLKWTRATLRRLGMAR
jgi:hypothetical protein